ncbi:MAG: zinc ribbon domain-containing protein [bacterium]|nr:zinc ribbon domain-containing protein [bacterium]
MPIFEFKCSDCDHKFEDLVPNSETRLKCPKCGSENTGKLMSTFAASAPGGGPAAPSCGAPSCGSGFS